MTTSPRANHTLAMTAAQAFFSCNVQPSAVLLPTAWCVLVFYSVRPCGMTPLGGLAFRSHKFVQGCRKAFKYLVSSPHSLALVNLLLLPFTLADPG